MAGHENTMADIVKWMQKLNELPDEEKSRELKSKLPDVVFGSLEKNVGYQSAIKYLQILLKWLQKAPDTLLHHDDNSSITGDYVLRLISFMVNAPIDGELFKLGMEIMQLLLNHVFMLDLTVFRSFFKDALLLLKDLEEVFAYFQTPSDGQVSIKLKCFQTFAPHFRMSEDPEKLVAEAELDVSSVEKIMSIQCGIVNLYGKFIEKAHQFLPDISNNMWELLFLYIQRQQSMDMLTETLQTVELMLTYCGAPAPILDDLAKVLCQLLTISEDRSDEADVKLSQCILKVLPLLRADAIQPLSLGFMEILQYVLQYSRCQPLKASLCTVLNVWIPKYPSLVEKLSDVLMPFIDDLALSKIMTECLITAIKHETKSTQTDIEQKPPKRRKLEFNDYEQSYSSIAGSAVLTRLLSLLDNCNFEFSRAPSAAILKTAVTVDVISRVFIEFKEIYQFDTIAKKYVDFLEHLEMKLCEKRSHDHSIMTVVNIAVASIRELLFTLDAQELSTLFEQIIRILTFPWSDAISITSKALPKKYTIHDAIAPTEYCIHSSKDPIVVSIVDKALCALNWLPPRLITSQRKKILVACLRDERPSVKCCAIRAISLFLLRNGADHLNDFVPIIMSFIDTEDAQLQRHVAFFVGHWTCLYTQRRNPKECEFEYLKDNNNWRIAPDSSEYSLTFLNHCQTCALHKRFPSEYKPIKGHVNADEYVLANRIDVVNTIEQINFKRLKELFVYMDEKKPSEVRVAFLSSLQRILQHVAVPNEDLFKLLGTVLSYSKESDPAIRAAIPEAIVPFVLLSDTDMLENLFTQVIGLEPAADMTTVLNVIGLAGSFVSEDALFFCLIKLIDNLTHNEPSIRATAYDQIRLIADKKKITMVALLTSCKHNLYPRIVQRLLESPETVMEFSSALLDLEYRDFLKNNMKIYLPHIIVEDNLDSSPMDNEQKKALIMEISSRVDMSPKDMLMKYLPYILTNCMLHPRPKQSFQMCSEVLTQMTEFKMTALFSKCRYQLVTKLLLKMTKGEVIKQRAYRALVGTCQQANDSQCQLSAFLKDCFLAIMNIFSKKLSSKTTMEKKLQTLQAVRELIGLLGEHLETFHLKIGNTIMLAEKYPPLVPEALETWLVLVKHLKTSTLGTVLSQMVVHMLGFVNEHQDKVLKILEFFFFGPNAATLQEFYSEIPFMPDNIPALQRVAAMYETSAGTSEATLQDTIARLIRVFRHDSANVRELALDRIIKVLREKRKEMEDAILNEKSNSFVKSFVEVLLEGCRDPNKNIRLKVGLALGELGAIDPSRVPIVVASEYGTSLDKENAALAIELIKDYLVKCYRTDRPGNSQDRAAFAIQEMLKYFGCSEETIEGRSTTPDKGGNFWIKLPPEVQLIIRPFLSSHYYELQKNSAIPNSVIYKSFLPYRKWVTEWVLMLIDRTNHPMFLACRGVVKVDLDTAHFLLPHLVLHNLTQGSAPDYKQIRDEIIAVIQNPMEMSPHKNAGGVGVRYFILACFTNVLQQPATEISQEATQRVFSLLDSLNRHVELKKRALTEKGNSRSPAKGARGSPSTALRRVEELLDDIPQMDLAKAALRVKAYARALLYYETHIRKIMKEKNKRDYKDFIAADLSFLQKVYSGLDELDSVGGLSNLRAAASTIEQITELEAQGRWHEALLYYDQAMSEKEDDITVFTGRLKCLQNLGRVEEVLELSRAALYDPHRFSKSSSGIIRLHGIRAAWRLSNWNALENLLSGVVDPDFEVYLAKALVAMKKNDEKEFQDMVSRARSELVGPLSAASLDSYERAYPFIIKEHMLAELEQCWNLVKNDQTQELPSIWEPRLKISQHSFKPHEQILHLRIVLAGMYLPMEVGQNWLRLAKTARISYQYDAAEHALLKASACRPRPDFYSVEHTKLLLQQGKESMAIITLKREIENKPLVDIKSEGPSLSDFVTDETGTNNNKSKKNKVYSPVDLCFAKNLVMLATFYHKTGQYSHDLILQRFNTASSVVDKWEKGFFALAQYYDHLIMEMKKESVKSEGKDKVLEKYALDLVPNAITNYGLAIRSGHTYIYQSLARLTTLWFDSYTTKLQPPGMPKSRGEYTIAKIERVVGCLASSKVISAYWLIMYSQLMSRVCTQAKQVWLHLRQIIVRVLLRFPHQASWYLAYLYKSPLKARQDKFAEIKAEALRRQKELQKEGKKLRHDVEEILSENCSLANSLLDLCNYAAGPSRVAQTYYMSKQFPKLAKYTQSQQIIPNQAQMTVTVPSHTRMPEDDYNPFPDRMVTIKGFAEEIEVLRSLQKPKKVKIIGSDGNRYTFLCKPDDDLRRDSRMMEFHTVINKLLKKNPDARRRQLHIRTYFVTPLNDKCGLIEWVPNTNGFRNIIYSMLTQEGIYRESVEKVRALYNKHSNTNKEKDGPSLLVFVNEILPLFPPVFWRWFLQTFPEPSTFFRARLAYARSLAVMSMVGYIVGLGDRHGENILLDSSSGDVVHVDFNCLFFKGLTFDKPEKVPFRLTPQMVDALGPLGYEGTFRQVCEVTMRQLRDNKDTLLSVLETFVYDPSFDGKNKVSSSKDATEDNPEALNILKGVGDRLEGKKRTQNNRHEFLMPLSVEGQVQSLIDEAVSFENLHQMYIGWASYL